MTALKEENANSIIREPSYFEIPCKEGENGTYELSADPHCSSTGHASFTIEFDEASPGKVTIKDHITKFSDHRQKSKKTLSAGEKELAGLHTDMIAAQSKVADWLAQNNPPRLLKEAAEEDSKSIKSDVPVYLKRLQGNEYFFRYVFGFFFPFFWIHILLIYWYQSHLQRRSFFLCERYDPS